MLSAENIGVQGADAGARSRRARLSGGAAAIDALRHKKMKGVTASMTGA